MNKTIWKLDRISERIWLIASSVAMEASKSGAEGRGFAVVAEEARNISLKISRSLEKTMFEQEDIDHKFLSDLGTQLSFLALNSAIEASRSGQRGKAVAFCAEDICSLAIEITELLNGGQPRPYVPSPPAANPMTSIDNRVCFMQFTAGGYRMTENLNFVEEVIGNKVEHTKTHVNLRGWSVPVIDCFSLLGEAKDDPFYLMVRAPWAKTNEFFAVAIDEPDVNALFYSPVGTPVTPDAKTPLSEYVRECWASTIGEPFRFMDWPKMISLVK